MPEAFLQHVQEATMAKGNWQKRLHVGSIPKDTIHNVYLHVLAKLPRCL